jgi:hypothetical protein
MAKPRRNRCSRRLKELVFRVFSEGDRLYVQSAEVVGENIHYITKFTLTFESEIADAKDRDLIAELSAIRYLLERASSGKLIPYKPVKGIVVENKNILEILASPVARKNNPMVWAYARYLCIQYRHLRIRHISELPPHVQKIEWEKIARYQNINLTIGIPMSVFVDSPNIGRVEITVHAIEKYLKVSNYVGDNVFESLCDHLRNKDISKAKCPPHVIAQKLLKYGEEPCIWKIKNSLFQFIFTNGPNGCPRLVTVSSDRFDQGIKFSSNVPGRSAAGPNGDRDRASAATG